MYKSCCECTFVGKGFHNDDNVFLCKSNKIVERWWMDGIIIFKDGWLIRLIKIQKKTQKRKKIVQVIFNNVLTHVSI